MMVKMALDYPGGDSKTLELRDIRTNVTIDDSAFVLLARDRRPSCQQIDRPAPARLGFHGQQA